MASNPNGGSIILSITARKYASYDPPDNPCKIINKGFSSSLIKSSLGSCIQYEVEVVWFEIQACTARGSNLDQVTGLQHNLKQWYSHLSTGRNTIDLHWVKCKVYFQLL